MKHSPPTGGSSRATSDTATRTGTSTYRPEEGRHRNPGRKNVHPEEIEEKLTKSPLIEEALVFSPDDSDIHAVIYPAFEEAGRRLASKGLAGTHENVWELLRDEVRLANAGLEPYKRVRHFAIRTEEFPKTTTRKIRRYLFKDLRLTPETRIL